MSAFITGIENRERDQDVDSVINVYTIQRGTFKDGSQTHLLNTVSFLTNKLKFFQVPKLISMS